ncbi:MocR-like pyridoxine biosynthesis transcription factor PdxR [Hymenobacter terricola]|uniref:MocR-like pyridoxine biosynthesis transcription factor PdxR n=1 Tax=Hymenobacter terricola TaxID=2819236 RepID=UPI001B315AAE|nr:PLP-dependent aminotransferase family protein [Hymenobacter terricola]
MLPFASLLLVDRRLATPVYQQLAAGIVRQIQSGRLPPGTRMPSTRRLSQELGLHRQTLVMAYAELQAQGWLESIPRRGYFVATHLPVVTPHALAAIVPAHVYPAHTGFAFTAEIPLPQSPAQAHQFPLAFDDGFPDVRLAPVGLLARAYRSVARRASSRRHLYYGPGQGTEHLRKVLAEELRATRGLRITADNILITRGSQMGICLTAQLLLRPGDAVVVGQTSYYVADAAFRATGAQLLRVPVDAHGLDVNAVQTLCQQQPIRLLYVTPHHHHPTTVTLRADRRLQLLQLAATHRFAVLEDDYDYDFHYASSPILPLASADAAGSVVYVGSLSKSLAPSIRVGYLVAPPGFVQAATRLRRLVDIQGDSILEEAIAELYRNGDIRRYLRKAVRAYEARRDLLCELLHSQLGGRVSFQKPNGGLAVWVRFAPPLSLPAVAARARQLGLYVNDGSFYDAGRAPQNALRLGFASLNETELREAVRVLAQAVAEA